MTMLSRRDWSLHNEDGSHIDPGVDRNLKARLKRHLDAHARNDLPELSMLGDDLSAAKEGQRAANDHYIAMRKYVSDMARQHVARGVPKTVVAKRLGINRRTLNDWLDFGRAR